MLPAPLWLALVRAMLVVDDGTRITPLSLHGESKEEAASPQKRKPTPPRCARQPLPREGARVDTPSFLTPSFLWKEGVRKEVGWGKQDEKDRGEIVSSASFARAALSPYRQSEYMHVWKNNTLGKAFPAWGRWRAKRAG